MTLSWRWWRARRNKAAFSHPPSEEAAVQGHLDRLNMQQALEALESRQAGWRDAHWWLMHGRVLRESGRRQEALRSFEASLAIDPKQAVALEAKGNVLLSLGQQGSALDAYDAALMLEPERTETHYNRGLALLSLNRPVDALAAFDTVLRAVPADAGAHVGRGNALLDLRRLQSAQKSYRDALRLMPNHPEALHNLGAVFLEMHQPDLAASAFEKLNQAAPAQRQVDGKLLHARMLACDWHDHDTLLAKVEQGLTHGETSTEPFAYQGISMDPHLQKVCASLAARAYSQAPAKRHQRVQTERRKLRIGYVSGEFRQQATSMLMVELFELHDRQRFDIVAFDNGWDDGSELRRRVVAAFDEVVDIASLSDRAAASAVVAREIDILVDLNGYFGLSRPGLFSWRPSPIQVNYLGFPGTLGAPWMDYIVADRRLIHPEDEVHYTERVVCLPGCYQPNDSTRIRTPCRTTRADAGLPEKGFVFCCFNNNYKITPKVFAVWMGLLHQLPGSVLWLLGDNSAAQRNLRQEAQARAVDPRRLIFAPRVDPQDHLARHALADLFLDTLPCNAHTTASDALGAGLPVLTCIGTTFSGRVASSLLHALELPELIAPDLSTYASRALGLARNPQALAQIRARLFRAPGTPAEILFGAAALRVHLESAYVRMAVRWREGLQPISFDV